MARLARPLAVAAAALALSACGVDRCPMESAFVDTTRPVPTDCSEASTTYAFSVGLCEDCRYTSPTCEADVLSVPVNDQPGEVFLATQWQVCPEDEGCPFQSGESCYFPTCVVSVPASGPYDVHYVIGTDTSGNFVTASFRVEFGATPDTCG